MRKTSANSELLYFYYREIDPLSTLTEDLFPNPKNTKMFAGQWRWRLEGPSPDRGRNHSRPARVEHHSQAEISRTGIIPVGP